MKTDIKLLGINIQREPQFDRNFAIMAFGDIGVDAMAMTLRGCALARLNGQIVAMPPKVPGAKPGDLAAIQWDSRGEFARAVCDRMIAGYMALGGIMPPDPTKKQSDGMNAARRYAEKEPPLEYRTYPAKFELVESEAEADDAEAVEGLHRTLSVEAEEAARACG